MYVTFSLDSKLITIIGIKWHFKADCKPAAIINLHLEKMNIIGCSTCFFFFFFGLVYNRKEMNHYYVSVKRRIHMFIIWISQKQEWWKITIAPNLFSVLSQFYTVKLLLYNSANFSFVFLSTSSFMKSFCQGGWVRFISVLAKKNNCEGVSLFCTGNMGVSGSLYCETAA